MSEQSLAQSSLRLEDLDPEITAAFTAPILSDSLDASGIRTQTLVGGVNPIKPGLRALGRAATLAFAPDDRDREDPYAALIDAIDGLPPGSVVMMATGADDRTAYWGELFSAAAMGRGAVGAVCDGPTRDTPKIHGLGFALFGNGTRPIDLRARMAVVSAGDRIECGGVPVSPGDIVLADDDGVVVVPQEHESEVLERAVARVTAERNVLAELLAGAKLREVWDRWKVL